MSLVSPRFASNDRLQKASENSPALKRGEKDPAIAILQQALIDLGYSLPSSTAKGVPTGVYDQDTYAAVKKFQKDHSFWSNEVDGIVGRDTLQRLDDLFPGGITAADRKKLSKNLGFSMQAVNYVLRTLNLKAPNWDKYRGDPSWEAGTASQDALDQRLYERDRPTVAAQWKALRLAKPGATRLERLRIISNFARKSRVGNCGENSALTFIYLYDMGVRPLDQMSLDEDSDHAFTVIGRTNADAGDYDNWGPSAVVCDSWAQGFRYMDKGVGTYPGVEFGDRMNNLVPGFKSVSSYHREE